MCSHVDLWMTVSMAGAMTVDNHCTAGRGMARDAALPHREGCRYAESVLEMLHLKPALKPASQEHECSGRGAFAPYGKQILESVQRASIDAGCKAAHAALTGRPKPAATM